MPGQKPGSILSKDAFSKGQRWLQPLLLLFAIALHGLVLTLPMPDLTQANDPEEPTPKEITPRPEAIKVARLPRVKPEEEPVPPVEASPPEVEPEPLAPEPQPRLSQPESAPINETTQPTPDSDPPPVDNGPETPPPPPTLEERLGDISNYVYSSEGVTKAEGDQATLDWYVTSTSAHDVATFLELPLDPPPVIELTPNECPDPTTLKRVIVGLLVGEDGTLLEDPIVLERTGYDDVETKIVKEAEALDFEQTGEITAYSLEFTINCTPQG